MPMTAVSAFHDHTSVHTGDLSKIKCQAPVRCFLLEGHSSPMQVALFSSHLLQPCFGPASPSDHQEHLHPAMRTHCSIQHFSFCHGDLTEATTVESRVWTTRLLPSTFYSHCLDRSRPLSVAPYHVPFSPSFVVCIDPEPCCRSYSPEGRHRLLPPHLRNHRLHVLSPWSPLREGSSSDD